MHKKIIFFFSGGGWDMSSWNAMVPLSLPCISHKRRCFIKWWSSDDFSWLQHMKYIIWFLGEVGMYLHTFSSWEIVSDSSWSKCSE